METNKAMAESYIKCLQDKTRIYIIENYLTTLDATSGGRKVPFVLFPKQKEFLFNLANYPNNITTKPRQSGMSTLTQAKFQAEIVLASADAPLTFLIITNNQTMSRDDLAKVRYFLEQFPRWMWGEEFYHPDPKHKNNIKPIFQRATLDKLEMANGCEVHAKSSGDNASRGVSACNYLWLDEAQFIENGEQVYASAAATTNTVPDQHIIMVSTPCGKDALYYGTYHGQEIGSNNFHITALKWFLDPRFNRKLRWWKTYIKPNEEGEDVEYTEWKEEQTIDPQGNVDYQEDKWLKLLGEGWHPTSPWYEKTIQTYNNNQQKIAQEMEVSFLGSDSIAIDPKIIEMHRELNVKDDYAIDPVCPQMRIFTPPISGHRYIMTVDGARGDAGDSSSISILDIDYFDENGIPGIDVQQEYKGKIQGDLLGEIGFKYGCLYNSQYTVVDCIGGYGEACILTMLRLGYPSLYYDTIQGKDYLSGKTNFTPNKDGQLPGLHNKGIRNTAVEEFISALRDNIIKIRSSRQIQEMETWIYHNGKIEHKSGFHDDILTGLSNGIFIYNHNFLQMQKQKEQSKEVLLSFTNSLKSGIGLPIVSKAPTSIHPNDDIRNKYAGHMVYSAQSLQAKKSINWISVPRYS